jgi:hypothetical protein
MNKILETSANGIAYLYSGIIATSFVATGLVVTASVFTVLAGLFGVM